MSWRYNRRSPKQKTIGDLSVPSLEVQVERRIAKSSTQLYVLPVKETLRSRISRRRYRISVRLGSRQQARRINSEKRICSTPGASRDKIHLRPIRSTRLSMILCSGRGNLALSHDV